MAVVALSACSAGTPPPRPAPHSAADRLWLDNATRFIDTLDSDLLLSTSGGANLATARRALRSQSDLYSLLVAYTLFGSCRSALANVGTPSARERKSVTTLVSACRRLERASALFELAVRRGNARALLRATRIALGTEPLLFRARAEVKALAG
jgi:hypothetical protein